jgi:hypothetical protein
MSGGEPKEEWTYAKCPCGHRACNQYTINRQGSVSFSLEDAQLIAAAPETAAERDRLKALNAELLEVLRLTADQALRCEIPEGYGPEFRSEEWDAGYDAAISSARAAIAKAEGGAA